MMLNRIPNLDREYWFRFQARVEKSEACWIWLGGRHCNGYGVVRIKN